MENWQAAEKMRLEEMTEREKASADPNILARNAAGHWDDCNYGDWGDFSKCDCDEGLANVPNAGKAYVVAPMPLRDFFAATVVIPWEEALNLAAAEAKERISLGGQVTLAQVVEARVRLRYLEADAMILRRAIAPAVQFEQGQERGKNYGASLSGEDEAASDGSGNEGMPTIDEPPPAG